MILTQRKVKKVCMNKHFVMTCIWCTLCKFAWNKWQDVQMELIRSLPLTKGLLSQQNWNLYCPVSRCLKIAFPGVKFSDREDWRGSVVQRPSFLETFGQHDRGDHPPPDHVRCGGAEDHTAGRLESQTEIWLQTLKDWFITPQDNTYLWSVFLHSLTCFLKFP